MPKFINPYLAENMPEQVEVVPEPAPQYAIPPVKPDIECEHNAAGEQIMYVGVATLHDLPARIKSCVKEANGEERLIGECNRCGGSFFTFFYSPGAYNCNWACEACGMVRAIARMQHFRHRVIARFVWHEAAPNWFGGKLPPYAKKKRVEALGWQDFIVGGALNLKVDQNAVNAQALQDAQDVVQAILGEEV